MFILLKPFCLFLLSKFSPQKTGDTWEWILEGTLDTSRDVAIYDIDLFDISKSQIKDLQNMGRKVVCYFRLISFKFLLLVWLFCSFV